ncbi:MAG: TolC family protein [Candidatus Omnitrophota bacterium]
MKKINLFLIICICLSPLSARAQEVFLTLEEALSLALRDNRDILLKTEDITKAREKISESRGGLWPTVHFTASQTQTRDLYDATLDQTAVQAAFKQYLYKGGKIVNTIEQSKAKLKVSEALLEKTRIEVNLQVKKAFYALLLAEDFVELNKGIVANTEKHLETIEARYQKGLVSELDILKIKESLESVQQAYVESLSQVDSLQSLLRNLLYLEEDVHIRPDGEFAYERKDIAYDAGFLKALQDRPEIRQYEAQERVDQRTIEITKADNRPSIYASWDYYSRSHLSFQTSRNWNDYNVLGLTFSWPIFDGWVTKSRLDQAIVDLKQTRLMKDKAIKEIALELKNAYVDLKNAIAQIKAAEADVAFYRNNLAQVQERYASGIMSFLDLDDALLSRQVSEFNKNQAIYNYIIAKNDFIKATGGL